MWWRKKNKTIVKIITPHINAKNGLYILSFFIIVIIFTNNTHTNYGVIICLRVLQAFIIPVCVCVCVCVCIQTSVLRVRIALRTPKYVDRLSRFIPPCVDPIHIYYIIYVYYDVRSEKKKYQRTYTNKSFSQPN